MRKDILKSSKISKYNEESSKMEYFTVKKKNMTVNGRIEADADNECSRRHQLEELKEDFMKMIKSKKSLKS
jgi:capsule polysaccharide export protein KpsC/LpsZ